MKLKTLESALNCAIAGTNERCHLEILLKARDEIIALADHCEDGLDADCSIVSWYTFSNLMNVATYDDFGKIYKENHDCRRVYTKLYRETCRDLWDVNEDFGYNKTDGSFADCTCLKCEKTQLQDKIETLGTIINKLYHHSGLSADDITDIQQFIH